MNIVKPLISLLGALAISGAANAAVLTSSTGPASNVVADYSGASLVSFDLDLASFSQTRLDFVVEDDDLLLPYLSLNAIVRNLSGHGFDRFNFTLDGIAFAGAGSVTPTFGVLGGTAFSANRASVDFSAPEWAEFHFGNPLAAGGAADWLLSTQGLRAGDAFSITTSVPEPATIALMLSGLAVMAYKRRRG
ncbi:PEP-CTERM sorting domain-containing protein [Pseudoduganella namucuonensis]|uniref:PEP-CTERM protein-sorting domain-containing protein n=1 Tax=Pseudoduganella namucuonensis TaxID=1035707 RepID=A0A1I7KD58_9BURK|nr:PEP-CTERM sorting domain-containing protein [Pseudoduganella namucuonensis]SFU95374.1 PEP-CTERM protein-sorting domain-containing protein [Pseudoduganella namucuonensis]